MSTRSSILSLLVLCVLGIVAFGLNDIRIARKQAQIIADARADLARFTHGRRQIASLNGAPIYLEVPPATPVVERGLANDSEVRPFSPDEIPEKFRQRGPEATF